MAIQIASKAAAIARFAIHRQSHDRAPPSNRRDRQTLLDIATVNQAMKGNQHPQDPTSRGRFQESAMGNSRASRQYAASSVGRQRGRAGHPPIDDLSDSQYHQTTTNIRL